MKSDFRLILCFAILFTFVSSGLFALQKDLKPGGTRHYCIDHLRIPSGCEEIREYLYLIPSVSKRCEHIECSACEKAAWLTEVINDDDDDDDDDGFVTFAYTCECMYNLWEQQGRIYRYPYYNRLPTWNYCSQQSIYAGYLAPHYKKYFHFLKNHLEYSKEYRECRCYWPELTSKAAAISDKAYELFIDLFTNTALSNLVDNQQEQSLYFHHKKGNFHARGLTLACICHSFYFSSYYYICKELNLYSQNRYSKAECRKIDQKLHNILDVLSPLFLELYESCLTLHPNEVIQSEKLFLEM